jgi:hypothetical protein
MSQESSPYDAVIADLEAKRDQMSAMIENLKQMRGLANSVVTANLSVTPIAGVMTTISHDAFFGMTILDAAKKYLSIVKKTVPHPQLCDALLEGGFKTSAANFREVVRSTLGRHPDFIKVNGQWGLDAWYGRGRKARPRENNNEEENSEVKPAAEQAV